MKSQKSLDTHLAAAKEQLERRASLGDLLVYPHEVEHLAFFRGMRGANIARVNLEHLGYRVVVERKGIRIVLHASHDSDIEAPTVAKFVATVFTAVSGAGGIYDGWGAFIEQPE